MTSKTRKYVPTTWIIVTKATGERRIETDLRRVAEAIDDRRYNVVPVSRN